MPTIDEVLGELTDSICAKSAMAVRTGKAMFQRQLQMSLQEACAFVGDTMACNVMAEGRGQRASMPSSRNARPTGGIAEMAWETGNGRLFRRRDKVKRSGYPESCFHTGKKAWPWLIRAAHPEFGDNAGE